MGRASRVALLAGAGLSMAAVARVGVHLVPRLSHRPPAPTTVRRAEPLSSGTATNKPLRILSQNVWNSFFAGGPERERRMRAFHEYLSENDVDVVAVQEMFVLALGPVVDKTEADEAAVWMAELGFVHQTSPVATLPRFGQSSGLVVYSKLPIVHEKHGVFSERRSVSCKGWLEVILDLQGVDCGAASETSQRLALVNTHLEHSHHPRWRAVRESQWRQVATQAGQLAETSSSLFRMALGDFNVCGGALGDRLDGGAEYRALSDAMKSAGMAHDVVVSTSAPTMRKTPEQPLKCAVDHMFVCDALRKRLRDSRVVDTRGRDGLIVSDHFGVLVSL